MQHTIDIRVFQPRYRNGLIFSTYEGLKEGCEIKFLLDEDPIEIKDQLNLLNIQNLKWRVSKINNLLWELVMKKSQN